MVNLIFQGYSALWVIYWRKLGALHRFELCSASGDHVIKDLGFNDSLATFFYSNIHCWSSCSSLGLFIVLLLSLVFLSLLFYDVLELFFLLNTLSCLIYTLIQQVYIHFKRMH